MKCSHIYTVLKSHKNSGYSLCINQMFTLFWILGFYYSAHKKYISEQIISFCEHCRVWDITWMSAIWWHLRKCRLQKSDILTPGQVCTKVLAVSCLSAGIHFVKCMDLVTHPSNIPDCCTWDIFSGNQSGNEENFVQDTTHCVGQSCEAASAHDWTNSFFIFKAASCTQVG